MNKRIVPPPQVTLEEIFSPRSVAIVGVSGSGKYEFVERVLKGHIDIGTPNVYPVNPKYQEIFGLPCYPSLLDIPGPVDHVIISLPINYVYEMLEHCARKQVKSVHIYTAGFGESGDSDRANLEIKMLRLAKRANFRIIGPNCVGLFVPRAKMVNDTGMPFDAGTIGFISQSGGHASNLPHFGALRGLRFSKVISYGNALDVDEVELLNYLADDSETEIIGAYIEGVKNGEAFFDALKAAGRKKPVIIYKGGRTEAGLRAAQGHTASMVSSVEIFDAVCRQANAIRVDNLDELQDVMVALHFLKTIPQDKTVALFGSGGGPSVLAGDELETAGLKIPRFSTKIQSKLKSVLPEAGGIFINPLDTSDLTNPGSIDLALQVFRTIPEIELIVYHLGFHPIGMWGTGKFSDPVYLKRLGRVMDLARQKTDQALLFALRPPQDEKSLKEFLQVQKVFVDHGFPVFHTLGQLANTMNKVINWKIRFEQGQ